jgi:hypothetical protein
LLLNYPLKVMVGVAQLVEHQVVALVAVGSSPITHPIYLLISDCLAPVAQLDRAPDFESVGRGFESLRARHNFISYRFTF